jgi:undecaprenyl-diphosphatase
MPLFETAAFAVLLGIVEFRPVPASAHLELLSGFLKWQSPPLGLLFAIHVGALVAVVCYYLADIVKITGYMVEAVAKKRLGPVAKVGVGILLASLPLAAAWAICGERAFGLVHSIKVIAWACIGFGLLLWISSYVNRHLVWRNILNIEGERHDSLRHVSFQQALIVGFAQIAALLPGTSRSGIVMTSGLFLGIRPEAAARFSFMLGIPVIAGLAIYEWMQIGTVAGAVQIAWPDLLFAAVLSFGASLASIHLFLKYVSKAGMGLFATYRIAFGACLLFFFA